MYRKVIDCDKKMKFFINSQHSNNNIVQIRLSIEEVRKLVVNIQGNNNAQQGDLKLK